MKLRNKKTGEIREVIVGGYPVSGETKMWECSEMDSNEETGYKCLGTYISLAELNEEWEDYEEPKSFWTINTTFDCAEPIVSVIEISERYYDDKDAKSIGNYFETKEEAEKAVEKLKAWKRLKDKGFGFDGWDENHHNLGIIEFSFSDVEKSVYDFGDDLDLLFSGGEE